MTTAAERLATTLGDRYRIDRSSVRAVMSTVYLAEGLTSRQRDRRGSGAYLRDSDVGKTDNARRRCHAGERAIR
jgi:hypothetical protein